MRAVLFGLSDFARPGPRCTAWGRQRETRDGGTAPPPRFWRVPVALRPPSAPSLNPPRACRVTDGPPILTFSNPHNTRLQGIYPPLGVGAGEECAGMKECEGGASPPPPFSFTRKDHPAQPFWHPPPSVPALEQGGASTPPPPRPFGGDSQFRRPPLLSVPPLPSNRSATASRTTEPTFQPPVTAVARPLDTSPQPPSSSAVLLPLLSHPRAPDPSAWGRRYRFAIRCGVNGGAVPPSSSCTPPTGTSWHPHCPVHHIPFKHMTVCVGGGGG